MNRLVSLLLVLALIVTGCAAGSESARQKDGTAPEKTEGGGY